MGIDAEIIREDGGHPIGQPQVATVLVLDTSYSMEDFKIDQLNEGLAHFKEDVMQDELARKRVDFAIVTFGEFVTRQQDFCRIEDYNPSKLVANGSTPMGDAIQEAINMVENRKNEYKIQGIDYYRPWIFLITDGEPTDMYPNDSGKWDQVISEVHNGEREGKFSFFAVGVEPADMNVLAQIAPPSRPPLQLNKSKFKEMFEWLSRSQKAVSGSGVGEQTALPPVAWSAVQA